MAYSNPGIRLKVLLLNTETDQKEFPGLLPIIFEGRGRLKKGVKKNFRRLVQTEKRSTVYNSKRTSVALNI